MPKINLKKAVGYC